MTRSPPAPPADCGSGWLVAIAGAIAVGAGIRHGSPFAGALGITLIAVSSALYLLVRHGARRVSVRRTAPETVFEGDEIEVRISLRNDSRLPLFFPRVTEAFAPEAHTVQNVVFPYRVNPGETMEERYRATCLVPRGIYSLGPMSVTIADPFGWFRVTRAMGETRQIKVYPTFQRFGPTERTGDSQSFASRHIARAGLGESTEFFSVREYRLGDPLRRVHWPLTAHRGFPVVREYTRTARGDLCIFLDLYRFALIGFGRGSSLEQSVKIAAGLSARAVGRGHAVRLFAKGASELRLGGAGGERRMQAILDALVELRPSGDVPLDEYAGLVFRQVLPGSIAVVMVSPYLRGSRAFEASLLGLKRAGSRVILAVFDEESFRNLYDLGTPVDSAPEYSARLRALGLEPFLVSCGGDIAAIFGGSSGS